MRESVILQCPHNTCKISRRTLLSTILVLSAVIAIAVLPGVGLQPTALRASRAAQGMFVGLSLLASVATGVSNAATPSVGFLHPAGESSLLSHPPLFELTCARLC
jgi:hypothetical protein